MKYTSPPVLAAAVADEADDELADELADDEPAGVALLDDELAADEQAASSSRLAAERPINRRGLLRPGSFRPHAAIRLDRSIGFSLKRAECDCWRVRLLRAQRCDEPSAESAASPDATHDGMGSWR